MYVITAKNIAKKYISGNHKVTLFNNISFHIQEGEIVYICGEYGSGRTTLLKVIAAITPPNDGSIEVLGKNLLIMKNRTEWRLKHIGYLTSDDCLIPYLTVKQHLLMGQDESDPEFLEEVEYIISILELSEDKLSLFPDQLEKVDSLKVALARIMLQNPRLLLLDEFTKDLPEDERLLLHFALINFAKQRNITIVMTGEIKSDTKLADRTLMLEKGKLIEVNENSKRQVFH